MTQVLLVRHPPVARAWTGRCYGRSDMGWSREGAVLARTLACQLADESIAYVVHSGALRTRRLAAIIGGEAHEDPRWLERDFGSWEGRRWDAIWRESGALMDRMMTHPHDFRPGGGETGAELSARARAAWAALPTGGNTLVIAHGGPIAAVRTWLAGRSLERMIEAVPRCGEIVRLPRHASADDA